MVCAWPGELYRYTLTDVAGSNNAFELIESSANGDKWFKHGELWRFLGGRNGDSGLAAEAAAEVWCRTKSFRPLLTCIKKLSETLKHYGHGLGDEIDAGILTMRRDHMKQLYTTNDEIELEKSMAQPSTALRY